MEELTFQGESFLTKEAAPGGAAIWDSIKAIGQKLHPGAINQVAKEVNSAKSGVGNIISKADDAVINPESLKLFNKDETVNKAREEIANESSGSFLTDGVLGLTKKIFPKSKEPINNAKVKFKEGSEGLDTSIGKAVGGEKPNWWGKMWSTPVQHYVGDEVREDGTQFKVLKEGRRPSALAPITNTLKLGTPLAAAAYVGEKLYPSQSPGQSQQSQQMVQNSAQAPYEYGTDKQASEEPNNLFDAGLVGELDKLASFQKIAELEENLSKYASQLEEVMMEKTAVENRLKEVVEEKDYFEKRANEAEQNSLEKEAAFEELRLRTIAQKRSKVAVDLAEQMLSCGLIKQAELGAWTDDLMECDESTIRRYDSLVKSARTQGESLESLSILGEYKGNDKLASSNKDLAAHGLSKSGQSIGEAVRDLIK